MSMKNVQRESVKRDDVSVSVIIYSMNRIGRVIKLVNKIKRYVDEIIVIDSSKKKKHEFLKKALPFAKIYWLPPIGIADIYYSIGMNVCSHSWILHLDDDEEPSIQLLEEIRSIPQKYNAKVFRITRFEKIGQPSKIVRFFHRKFVKPTGIIHNGYIPLVPPLELDSTRYYIHHKAGFREENLNKYVILESISIGWKIRQILNTINKNFKKRGKLINRFVSTLMSIDTKVTYFLLFLLFLLYYFIRRTKKMGIKGIKRNILYCSLIFFEVTRNFSKYFLIWENIGDKTLIEWLKLYKIDDLYEYNISFSDNGLKNLEKLIQKKVGRDIS